MVFQESVVGKNIEFFCSTTVSWEANGFSRNCGRKNAGTADVGDFRHVFAVFRCLIGPLVVILPHILVEEVLSFDLHGHTSKSDKY